MLVAISQRQSDQYGGSDILEASYVEYFSKLGVTMIPIPNHAVSVGAYFKNIAFDGVILSGGGDIYPSLYGDVPIKSGNYSPERDGVERCILDIAIRQDIPVLGICRGMESINVYFDGKIQNIKTIDDGLNHDETRHEVIVMEDTITESLGQRAFEVNSYHRMVIGAGHLSHRLRSFAVASDHTIEGFYSPEYAIAGIVWHPERERTPHTLNEFLIEAFLKRKLFWQLGKKGIK